MLLLLLLPMSISAKTPFVEIYKTHDNGLYGRSEDRDILLSLKDTVFQRRDTLGINNEYNFLTAVVLDNNVASKLENMMLNKESIQIGFVKISKDKDIYTIEDDNLFLSFSFSLERPNTEVLNIINEYYQYLPNVAEAVTDHYINNFIIRIHSAENILLPEAKEITYDEGLVMATIIGDKEQWLMGVHDGSDYLKDLLF